MTLQEIGERLKAEFPGRYVAFTAEASWFGGSTETVVHELVIYAEEAGHIKGAATFDEAVVMLKRRLGEQPAGENFDVEVGEMTAMEPTP